MDNKKIELQIGFLVFAALVALVALTIYFGKGASVNFGDEYEIHVRFNRAPGIARNTPVFKNGVRVGRVSSVDLIEQDREVEIGILLPKERKIFTDEECRIRQKVIMGDASLEFVKNPDFVGETTEIDPTIPLMGVENSDLLSGISSMEDEMSEALKNISTAATDFSTVAGQVNDLMGGVNAFIGTPEDMVQKREEFAELLSEMRMTMQAFHDFTTQAHSFINDPDMQASVKKAAAEMPELVANSNRFVNDARTFVERTQLSLERIDASLETAGAMIEGVREITDAVRGDVPEITGNLKNASKQLESLFDELTMIVQNFRNSDGSLKRLIQDPALYEKVLKLVGNLDRLSADVHWMLRTDVKPIADNVKILTDKAARDPAIFVRNLLKPQPRTKGVLPAWNYGQGTDMMNWYSCQLDPSCQNGRGQAIRYDYGSETILEDEMIVPTDLSYQHRSVISIPAAPRRFDAETSPAWNLELETEEMIPSPVHSMEHSIPVPQPKFNTQTPSPIRNVSHAVSDANVPTTMPKLRFTPRK